MTPLFCGGAGRCRPQRPDICVTGRFDLSVDMSCLQNRQREKHD
jgi:hypothetical protein